MKKALSKEALAKEADFWKRVKKVAKENPAMQLCHK